MANKSTLRSEANKSKSLGRGQFFRDKKGRFTITEPDSPFQKPKTLEEEFKPLAKDKPEENNMDKEIQKRRKRFI